MISIAYLKECKNNMCTELTRNKNGYCDEHQKEVKEDIKLYNKHYDKYIRNKESKQFYNSDVWINKRKDILNMYNEIDIYEYYVNKKIVISNTVHHIEELLDEWDLRLDEGNLFPCSQETHSLIHVKYKVNKIETQRELKEFIRRYREEFGLSPL